jgi:hypothetical protein
MDFIEDPTVTITLNQGKTTQCEAEIDVFPDTSTMIELRTFTDPTAINDIAGYVEDLCNNLSENY